MSVPKVRSEGSDKTTRRRRQRLETENPVGKRIIEALSGKDLSWLSAEAGVSSSTLSDYVAKGISRADYAVRIAAALGTTVEWLMLGGRRTPALVEAGSADWIDVPEYNLRDMTEETLGAPATTTPIRRDWLYSTFRTSSGLWLTRLLSDYAPAGLQEDMLVICRTVGADELAEGNICLWRVAGRVVTGRFSVIPDALVAQGALAPLTDQRGYGGAVAAYADPAMGISSSELIVPPSRLGGDGPYHLVGRILGVMLRPL